MKKIFLFLALAATSAFTSCSDDDSENTNQGGPTSITVMANAATVPLGSTVTFTVKDNEQEIVTEDAVIYVEGQAIEGNTIEADEAGEYTVYAKLGNLRSADITVTVAEEGGCPLCLMLSDETVTVGEEVTFASWSNDVEVTDETVFYVNDEAIEGNTFTPDAAATYSIHAKYNNITSDEKTLVVEGDAGNVADNSIIFDGEEYVTDASMLVYLGSDIQQNLSYWMANSFVQTEEGYPNDVYLYFATEQISDTDVELPTLGQYNLGNAGVKKIYNLEVYLDFETAIESKAAVAQGKMNLSAFTATDAENSWTYTYEFTLNNGTEVTGEFHGDWTYMDNTGGGDFAAGGQTYKVKPVSRFTSKQKHNK